MTASRTADDAGHPIAPDNLLRALSGFDYFVFGDFTVCPFTPERKGEMQMVCVEKAEHLVVKPSWPWNQRMIVEKSPFH